MTPNSGRLVPPSYLPSSLCRTAQHPQFPSPWRSDTLLCQGLLRCHLGESSPTRFDTSVTFTSPFLCSTPLYFHSAVFSIQRQPLSRGNVLVAPSPRTVLDRTGAIVPPHPGGHLSSSGSVYIPLFRSGHGLTGPSFLQR